MDIFEPTFQSGGSSTSLSLPLSLSPLRASWWRVAQSTPKPKLTGRALPGHHTISNKGKCLLLLALSPYVSA